MTDDQLHNLSRLFLAACIGLLLGFILGRIA